MRDADTDVIRRLPLFHDISEGGFTRLAAGAFLQRFPTGVTLIHEGEPADFLHVVVEGMVELFARHDGRETTIGFVGPVSTFILAAVVVDQPYLKSARTLAPSRVLMLPAEAVREVFASEPAFARAIVEELAQRYREVVKELKNQKLRTAVERLAAWMIVTDAEQGGTGHLRVPYEKRTLASRLGMTPENLSRAFATLSDYGVEVKGRDIQLRDRGAVARVARPHPLIDP
jgi:CRP/FNR family transcriptional activator FtrB